MFWVEQRRRGAAGLPTFLSPFSCAAYSAAMTSSALYPAFSASVRGIVCATAMCALARRKRGQMHVVNLGQRGLLQNRVNEHSCKAHAVLWSPVAGSHLEGLSEFADCVLVESRRRLGERRELPRTTGQSRCTIPSHPIPSR